MTILNKKLFLLLIPLLFIVPVYAQQTTPEIPGWVKGVANFWAEGSLTDDDFIEAIVFLVEQKIIPLDIIPPGELELKDLQILALQEELVSVGLDNSNLLINIVQLEQEVVDITIRLDEDHHTSHIHKTGNVGGTIINEVNMVDLIERLAQQTQVRGEISSELNRESFNHDLLKDVVRDLELEIEQLKLEIIKLTP